MTDHSHDDDLKHADHAMPKPIIYTATWIMLLGLLFVNYLQSQYLDLGAFNIVIALVICLIQASAVVLIMMGVNFHSTLVKFWALVGFVWLMLLFTTLGDYITRHWIHLPQGW